jgi:hypothetical protein
MDRNTSILPAMLGDRDERIAARRARREARKAGDSRNAAASKGKTETKKEESQSEKQMGDSKQVLDVLQRQALDEITSVSIVALERESQRRIKVIEQMGLFYFRLLTLSAVRG